MTAAPDAVVRPPPRGRRPARNIVFVLRNMSLGGIPRVVIELSAAWAQAYPDEDVHILLLDDSGRHYDTPDGVIQHDMTHLLNDVPGKLVRAGNKVLPNLCSVLTMGRNSRALCRWADELSGRSGASVAMVICGYGAISALRPGRIPNAICVAHNLYAAMLAERTGWLSGLNKRLLGRVLDGVTVYGISTPIRDTLRQDIGAIVQERVLYNPVDVPRIRALAGTEAAPDLGAPYLLYLGRLSPEKNVDAIIEAFGTAAPNSDVVLAIAGEGSERARLEGLAAEQAGRVRLLGALKNPFPTLAGATALVLASDFEGMPTVLLEARALGIPIVTTSAKGASAEAVEGYAGARLVADGDTEGLSRALAEVLSDASHRQPDDLDRFTTRACIERYRESLHDAQV